MSDICDNMYSACNSIIIQVAWFMEQVWTDLKKEYNELALTFEEDIPIENRRRTHRKQSDLLKPYKYVSQYDVRVEEYEGDEDWLEPWDKV